MEWRVAVIATLAIVVVACGVTERGVQQEMVPDLSRVDHLVYATPDLQAGVDQVEELLGVRATAGGQHPGLGTRNALVSLGPRTYLEIIGPDPEQDQFQPPRPFGIDELTRPTLVTWAANGSDLDQLASLDLGGGRLGEVGVGSRQTPQGALLSWRFTNPRTVVADGIVPFFINWGDSPHPAETAAQGAVLVGLEAEHPEAERVRDMLRQLGLTLRVSPAPEAKLVATIMGRHGLVELR